MQYPRWLLRLLVPRAVQLLEGNTIRIDHALKTWPHEFQAIRQGLKTYEVRKTHDRDFRSGSVLKLQEFALDEFDPAKESNPGRYTNRYEVVLVTYVGRGVYTSRDSMLAQSAMSIVRLGLTEEHQYGIELKPLGDVTYMAHRR